MADLIAFGMAVILAFLLDATVVSPPLDRAYHEIIATGAWWHGWGTLVLLVLLVAYLGSIGHYTRRIPFWTETGTLIGAVFVAFVGEGFIKIAVYRFAFGYEGTLRWLLFIPTALIARQAMRSVLDLCGLWSLRTLIVGDPTAIECVKTALLSQPTLGYEVIASVGLEAAGYPDEAGSWERLVGARDADFTVVAWGRGEAASYRVIISALLRARAPFAVVPTFEGLPVLGFSQQYFFSHDVIMLVCRNNLARPLSRLLKLAFDEILATVLLVVLAPLFITIALLVAADGGPVFFSHRRIGANGKAFNCLKFRTMVVEADRVLNEILKADAVRCAEWEATNKLQNDPRITPIGRVLRRTSLDELPQLVNVLRGEMSLVGPRPIVEQEISRYGENIDYYYQTRPGITGLWQVSGRSRASYQRRVQLDVWYVKNWTLWHDITILLKTVRAVLARDGAM